VTDNDAAAAFVFPGEVTNEVNVHGVGGVADIEMHVDVDVELAGERKNVALDQARTGKPTFGIVDVRVRGQSGLYHDDAAICDSNVRELVRLSVREPRCGR
jgi:hypothetical protein